MKDAASRTVHFSSVDILSCAPLSLLMSDSVLFSSDGHEIWMNIVVNNFGSVNSFEAHHSFIMPGKYHERNVKVAQSVNTEISHVSPPP